MNLIIQLTVNDHTLDAKFRILWSIFRHQLLEISILFLPHARPPTDRPKMISLQLYMLRDWGANDLKKGILCILSTYSTSLSKHLYSRPEIRNYFKKYSSENFWSVFYLLRSSRIIYRCIYSPELFTFGNVLIHNPRQAITQSQSKFESHDTVLVFFMRDIPK